MSNNHFDVLIVGAGISGISAAYYIQTQCPKKSFAILEGRSSIGGTWDLFKYPGIRSDSDMYTLGFAFKPWTSEKAIADGPSIMSYLHETIEENDLEEKIVLNQRVEKASWSSEDALWTLEVSESGESELKSYTCNFLSMCSGYYNYEEGYMPDFAGLDNYKGTLIHPQHWPSDLDYSGKKIVVIGSGATAVTLIPELAKKAGHVTMLQRSPTYVVSAPEKDKLANWMNRNLPKKFAYSFSRWRKILFQRFSFSAARKWPNFFKKLMISGVKKELGKEYDVAKHFTPNYKPWDQRICLVPDSDLFESIKANKADVVTDLIDTFTSSGLKLKSGKVLDADIIVSATGLNLQLMGDVQFVVDNKTIDFAQTISYKSMMFSDLPNLSLAFGYTNASWTLKCDLTSMYVARLLNYMDKHGYKQCKPVQSDPDLSLLPWLDFTSGYIQRHIHKLPKSGDRKPWKLKQDYIFDRMMINRGKIDDGVLKFA